MRGGARQGAGRKCTGTGRRVRVTITLSPEAYHRMKEWKGAGVIRDLGRIADEKILKELCPF